ncbi:MAG: tetratricopeptide repeat protein [Thermoplasmata archaeon]|nr:MAG: tetratricopeptide repeat protein [Thermoplasmata archaeon]
MKKKRISTGPNTENFNPEKPKNLIETGNQCYAEGKESEAIAYYNMAIDYLDSHKDNQPSNRVYISGLYKDIGQALIKANREKDALRIIDKALHLDPRNTDIWVNRGRILILITSKMHDEALKSFDAALKIEPKEKNALGFKGEAYEKINRPDLAKECYLTALEHHPKEVIFYDRILNLNPEDKSIWLKKAEVLDEDGKYENALECYDKVLELGVKNKEIWANRAWILGKLDKYEESAFSFKKALEIDEKDANLWKGMGSMLHSTGKLREAQDAFENAIKLDEKDHESWNNIGSLLFEMGSFEEALNAHEKALALVPDDIETLNNKKKILMALAKHEDVIKVCDIIIELDPENLQTQRDKGSVLLLSGKPEKAIEIFDKILVIDPMDLKTLNGKKKAYWNLKQLEGVLTTCKNIVEFFPDELNSWIDMGAVQEELGQVDEALYSYDTALKIEPDNLDILLKKTNSLMRMGKDEEIISTCNNILSIEPENSKALENKAASLLNLERNKEAIEVLDFLLNFDSDNANGHFRKGIALSRTGAHEEALKCYNAALNLDPNNKEILEDKGDTLRHLNKLEEAVSCYDLALKLDEEDVEIWDKRGKILLEKEMFQEVFISYEKALTYDPKNQRFLYLMGLSLDKLNRYDEAQQAFDSALELNERYEDALLGKGLVLIKMEREGEALDALNKVLDVNRDNLNALEGKRGVLKKLGNFKELDSICDKILLVSTNNIRALEDKAYALMNLGEHDAAVSAYDKVLSIEPGNLKLLGQKKETLKHLGKHEDVISTCDKILGHEPNNKEAMRDKSEALENLERYDEAIKVYDNVLESSPRDIFVLHKKAQALARLERYEASLKCYDEALNFENDNKMLLTEKGILLSKMEDYENAIKSFDCALKLDPDDDNILTNKALALYKSHMYDGALEVFNRVMELSAGKEGAKEGIRKGITVEINIFSEILTSLKEGDEKGRCLALLSNAKEALDKDNYIGAHGHIVECKNVVRVYRKDIIKAAETSISLLREMGGDTSEFGNKLGEVKSIPEDKNYPEALTKSGKIIQDIDEKQKSIVTDMLTGINDNIQQVKDMGIDFLKQENALTRGKEALNKGLFKEAYSIICQIKDEIQMIRERYKGLSETLGSVIKQLEEARKMGIDMSAPLKKIDEIKLALKTQDFDTASKKIQECDNDVKQLTTAHLIKEKIIQSQEFIDILKDIKMDTSDLELHLKKSAIYLKNEQYENALDSAVKTAEKAKELCSTRITALLSSVNSIIIDLKKSGLEVMTVEVLYQKARDAQESYQYKNSARYTLQSLVEIEDIRDESQRAANIIYLAGNYIREAENINADISEAKALRAKAISELMDSKYISSIEHGKKCIILAKRVKERKVSESIDLFQSIIDRSKSEGKDVFEAYKMLKEAKDAFADRDIKKALQFAMQSESVVGKADLQKRMVEEFLDKTTENLKEAEKNGIGSERIKALLTNASTELDNHDYVKALGHIMESGMELLEVTEEYERASTTLSAASARISEGKDIGVNIRDIKETFDTAKKEFDGGKYLAAIKLAKETIRLADRLYKEHLLKPIDSCKRLISTAESLGFDVSRANNMLNEAKAAMEEGYYLQVTSFTDSCKKLVERGIKRYLYEKLFSVREELDVAKKEGIDITDAMALVESAESALEDKEYIDATNYFLKLINTYGAEEAEGLDEEESSLGEARAEDKKEEK